MSDELRLNLSPVNRGLFNKLFKNTRDRELKRAKIILIAFLILTGVVPWSAYLIARNFPDSNIAFAVRASLLDPTSLETPVGKRVVASGNKVFGEISDTLTEIVGEVGEKINTVTGYTAAQKTNEKLAAMEYLGKGFYATETVVTGFDYDPAQCELSEVAAATRNKPACGSALKTTYDTAAEICLIKYDGYVASHREIMTILIPSKKITQPNEPVWTRQSVIEDSFWFWQDDIVKYLVYNPQTPDDYSYIDGREMRAFYCVTKTKPE